MENNPLFKENKLDKDSVLEYFRNKIAEKAYEKLVTMGEESND